MVVMNIRSQSLNKILAVLLAVLVFPVLSAQAAVIAAIDRANVELNESFTLKITVDTAIDVEPDALALEEDFYVENDTVKIKKYIGTWK